MLSIAQSLGFTIGGLSFSPVKGPEGNIEFLLYLLKNHSTAQNAVEIDEVVFQAHQELDA